MITEILKKKPYVLPGSSSAIIIISISFGLLFGLIDSFVSSYFFLDGSIMSQIFTDDNNVLWKRSLVLIICIINGIIIIILLGFRRKTANDLFESRETFKNVFEYSAVGIAIAGLDGRYEKVNPSFAGMLGYTEEEMLGKNFKDITHPDDLDSDLALLSQLMKEEINFFSMEKRYVHKNGTSVWAYITISIIRNSAGRPVHYISLFNNISDKKEASFIGITEREKALFEKNRSFQELNQIFNSIGIGLCLIDLNFNIARANDAYAKLFNRDINSIIGHKCNEVMPDILCSSEDCPLVQIRNGKASCEFETQKQIDNGTVLTFIVTATPFKSPEGEIQGITLTFTDITEIRLLEKTIAAISEQERQNLGQLLHDELGQLVTGLIFRIGALKSSMNEKNYSELEDVQAIEDLLKNVQLHMRRIMIGLYPPNVQYDRLLAALQHLASETEKIFGIKCHVISENEDVLVTDYTEITQLFYIASECVHNIVKHANAKNIFIVLSNQDDIFTMRISSDNKMGEQNIIKKGLGIKIMEYRARMIKSKFEQFIENGILINRVQKRIFK